MKITKNVPTEPGLNAAHAAAEKTGIDDFRDWAEDRGYFDDTTVAEDDLAAILPEVPDTPMGRAWTQAMTEALALTQADEIRAYDDVEFGEYEHKIAGGINEVADTVKAASPLLKDVADAIRWHAWPGSVRTVGAFAAKRSEITDEGILIRQWANHTQTPVVVPWSHIEPIVPGLLNILTRLLNSLNRHVPSIEPEENPGASRTPDQWATK